MTWQLQEAKNKFSELVDTSISSGPQIITRRGKDTAVLLSYAEYQQLITKRLGVKEALLALDISELDLGRDRTTSGRATPFELTDD